MEVSWENVSGGGLWVFRKASFEHLHDKFIFVINLTEQDNILISYLNWLTFDIFILLE